MTREEALQYYFAKCPRAEGIVKKIMMWDEDKTVQQNAAAISCPTNTAKMFARRFGFTSKFYRGGRGPEIDRKTARKLLKIKRRKLSEVEIENQITSHLRQAFK